MSQEQKKPRGFANAPASQSETVKTGQTDVPSAKSALDKLEAAAGTAKVIHGANDGVFKVVGSKVSTVRASLVDAFNIPGDALTFVNGEQVDGSHVLQENDTLEFVKQAGVKG